MKVEGVSKLLFFAEEEKKGDWGTNGKGKKEKNRIINIRNKSLGIQFKNEMFKIFSYVLSYNFQIITKQTPYWTKLVIGKNWLKMCLFSTSMFFVCYK